MTDANKIRVLVDWVKFQERSGYPVPLSYSDICSIANNIEGLEVELDGWKDGSEALRNEYAALILRLEKALAALGRKETTT